MLDDIAIFHAVATHGSFTAAGASLGLPKATVSKRVARLEATLDIRLLQRSTRRLSLTEVGQAVFANAAIVMDGLDAARSAARDARGEPVGTIRMNCPQGLMRDCVAPMLHLFLRTHPRVSLDLSQHNHPVDPIADRLDVALRVRTVLAEEGDLVVRRLGTIGSIVVASADLVAAYRDTAGMVASADVPVLCVREHQRWWPIDHANGRQPTRRTPRLVCEDFTVLLEAAIAGLGVAMLPEHMCRSAMVSGALVRLVPDHVTESIVHAVFPSRRGLPSATRALLDHLAAEFAKAGLGRSIEQPGRQLPEGADRLG